MSIKQTKTNYSHVCVGVQRSTFNPQPSVHCWDSEGYHWRPCACQRLWYSKGPRWSGLVVMVKVMFIDESSGCCHHASLMRHARWPSIVVVDVGLSIAVSRRFSSTLTGAHQSLTLSDGSTTPRFASSRAQWVQSIL